LSLARLHHQWRSEDRVIKWGPASARRKAELHPDLQLILDDYAALADPETLDLSITCGHRDDAAQAAALASGHSTKGPGQSKHNSVPSRAFDFQVYPPFPDGEDQAHLGGEYGQRVGALLMVAARRGIALRCGIEWHRPFDPGHVELAD
jgi:peptidoglycan LD-endopeptidase CwlK